MKFLKNPIIIILIISLFIGIISIGVINSKSQNIYKELSYASYDEVLDSKDPTVYYYFQTTCHYCESIKGELTKFVNKIPDESSLELKLIDMKDAKNSAAWYDWDSHNKKYGNNTPASNNPNYIDNPELMKNINDIKITGTPTMIYVKDNKVIDYQVGKDVFKLLNKVIDENNIDVTLDDSVYGK